VEWGSVVAASGCRAQVGGRKMGEQGIFLIKKVTEPNRRRFSKEFKFLKYIISVKGSHYDYSSLEGRKGGHEKLSDYFCFEWRSVGGKAAGRNAPSVPSAHNEAFI